METALSARVQATSHRLVELLLVEPVRSRWEKHAATVEEGVVNQAAVAAVLSDHLFHAGLVAEDQATARQLKDRVSRALNGRTLTRRTLRDFVEAFEVEGDEARELWRLHDGEHSDFLATALKNEPVRHETVSLREFHTVGPDRLPVRHETYHVIRAISEGFERYPYRIDTSQADVEVVFGGTAAPVRTDAAGLHVIDLLLPRPLARRETASLEYRTHLRYVDAPPPQFRRAVRHRLRSIDVCVQFHPDALPSTLEWCRWTDLDSPPVEREPAELNEGSIAHRHYQEVRSCAVGLVWSWT